MLHQRSRNRRLYIGTKHERGHDSSRDTHNILLARCRLHFLLRRCDPMHRDHDGPHLWGHHFRGAWCLIVVAYCDYSWLRLTCLTLLCLACSYCSWGLLPGFRFDSRAPRHLAIGRQLPLLGLHQFLYFLARFAAWELWLRHCREHRWTTDLEAPLAPHQIPTKHIRDAPVSSDCNESAMMQALQGKGCLTNISPGPSQCLSMDKLMIFSPILSHSLSHLALPNCFNFAQMQICFHQCHGAQVSPIEVPQDSIFMVVLD